MAFNIILLNVFFCCILELSSDLFVNMGLGGWRALRAYRKEEWIEEFLEFSAVGIPYRLMILIKSFPSRKKVLAWDPEWPRSLPHFPELTLLEQLTCHRPSNGNCIPPFPLPRKPFQCPASKTSRVSRPHINTYNFISLKLRFVYKSKLTEILILDVTTEWSFLGCQWKKEWTL